MIVIRILFAVFPVLFSTVCIGQKIGFEPKIGYATYSMKNLSEFQHDQVNPVIPIKVTNDFPGNINGGFSVYYQPRENFEIGIDYSVHSTIGRVHYKDYSGEIGIDQKVKAYAPGIFIRGTIAEKKRISVKLSASVSAWFTSVYFTQYLRIGDFHETEEFELVATNIGLTGAIEPVYSLNEMLYIGFKLGGMIEAPETLHLGNDHNAVLRDSYGNEMHANWAGFRSEFYIGIRLSDQ